MNHRGYYVYILANASGTLYTGMTNNLKRRLEEHREGRVKGFTRRYNIAKLLFAERFGTAMEAIVAEKRIKGWTRAKKLELIREDNPSLNDLSREWFEE